MPTDAFPLLLVVVAIAFAGVVVWRVRPALGDETGETRDGASAAPPKGGFLAEIEQNVAGAASDETRARALCDAGDACMARLGRRRNAASFFLRAMRTSPTSSHVIDRVARGLSARPRAQERLLLRYLGAGAWDGARREAVARALGHLVALYEGPLRSPLRARATQQAAALLGAGNAAAGNALSPEARTRSEARDDG